MNFYFVFICGDSPVCAKGFGTGGFSTNDTVEPYECRGGSCFYIEVAAVDCGFGLIFFCQKTVFVRIRMERRAIRVSLKK